MFFLSALGALSHQRAIHLLVLGLESHILTRLGCLNHQSWVAFMFLIVLTGLGRVINFPSATLHSWPYFSKYSAIVILIYIWFPS